MQGRVLQSSVLVSLGQNQLYMPCRESEILLTLLQKEPKMQMCSLVTLTLLIVSEVQVPPAVFLCFVLVSLDPISLSPCTVSFHSHFSGLLSWLLPWVCYGMRSMCALIMGKIQAHLDFYPLGPQIEPLEHTSISTELELRFGWELTHCFLPTERLDTMCQLVDCAMTTIR